MDRRIYKTAVAPHNFRVGVDGGIPSDNVQAAILLMQDNLEWVGRDKFMCISPELFGSKIRTSAPYQFATKGYSANSPQQEAAPKRNLINNSEVFSSWAMGAALSITASNILSPIGTNNGTEITTTNNNHYIFADIVVIPNIRYTFSFYTKKGTMTNQKYRLRDVTGGTDIIAPTSYYSEIGSDWTRISVTITTPANCVSIRLYMLSDSGSTGTCYLWGAQLEQLHYASPYQWTTATAWNDFKVDLSQSTANSQPYLSKIAPSEPQGLQNTNGDSRLMSHPAISFAANEKWCFESVLVWNGGSTNFEYAFAGTSATSSGILFRFNGVNRFAFNQLFGSFLNVTWDVGSTNVLLGKNNHVALVYDGSFIELFINGVSLGKKAWDKTAEFSTCLSNIGTRTGQKIHYYSIIPDSLSASRIAYRAALLRSIFPEIPTVRIAGLDVAVRALDIVCTPAGTLIPNVTDNSAWAALTTAAWCHHSNDLALGSVYGKIYNGYAKDQLVADLASSNFGYHVATEAEWNAILATGVAGLKAMGTSYWTSANGTNVSGLTLLGGAFRTINGDFSTLKLTCDLWYADSDYVIRINNDNTTAKTYVGKKHGAYILLIKNYSGGFVFDSLGQQIFDVNGVPWISE